MPAAYVGAAAAVYGAATSGDAAKSAAGAQVGQEQQALALQQQMYQQGLTNMQPFLNTGIAANNKLGELLGVGNVQTLPDNQTLAQLPGWNDLWNAQVQGGMPFSTPQEIEALRQKVAANYEGQYGAIPGATNSNQQGDYGSLLTPFSASDLTTQLAPNYAFMLDQGQSANKNAANLGGGLLGGNALQGLNTFTQNYAQNAYQQAYNNYNTNQSNIYARLSGTAQAGQAAAAGTASNALAAAGQQGSTLGNIGQSQASGIVGQANALSQGLQNASSYYNLAQIMNGSGSGGYNVAGNGAAMGTGSGGYSDAGFSQYLTG